MNLSKSASSTMISICLTTNFCSWLRRLTSRVLATRKASSWSYRLFTERQTSVQEDPVLLQRRPVHSLGRRRNPTCMAKLLKGLFGADIDRRVKAEVRDKKIRQNAQVSRRSWVSLQERPQWLHEAWWEISEARTIYLLALSYMLQHECRGVKYKLTASFSNRNSLIVFFFYW